MSREVDIQNSVVLALDTTPEYQTSNTSRCIINMHDIAGEKGALVSEKGNTFITSLPGKELGRITLDRFRTIIFTNDHSINLFNSTTDSLETLVTLPEFNFNYDIVGTSRQVRGCEDVIYWCDYNNADRYFNITRPEKFKVNGLFDVDLFDLNFKANVPNISFTVLDFGGNLDLGTYYPIIEYVDDFENVLYRSIPHNEYIPIGQGLNIADYDPITGGVNQSKESIKLDITNINDEVSYVRVSFIVFRAGTGYAPTAVTINRLFPVYNNTASITYTNSDQTTLTSVRELLQENFYYKSSRNMTQVHNRLLRVNLKEEERDYSTYQTYASKVCSRWVTQQNNLNRENTRTEIGGEIKSYAIHYIHRDGFISPAFPLIPKETQSIEKQQYQINIYSDAPCNSTVRFSITYRENGENITKGGEATFEDLKSNFLKTDNYIEIVNFFTRENPCGTNITARVDTVTIKLENQPSVDDINIYDYRGNFGVYYTEEKYLNPPNFDCKNFNYWGEDCDGNKLTDTNVRYFRVPDRSLVPLFNSSSKYDIGVEFYNIDYPNDDIVGHFFSSSTYDVRTINAKGLLIPYAYSPYSSDDFVYSEGRFIHNVNDGTVQSRVVDTQDTARSFVASTDRYSYSFITNDFYLLDRLPEGDTINIEGNYDEEWVAIADRRIGNFFDTTYNDLDINLKPHIFPGYNLDTASIIEDVTQSISLNPRSSFDKITNNSYTNKFNIIELSTRLNETTPFKYASLRTNTNPFSSIWNISYRPLGKPNQNIIFNGDGFISPLNITNLTWISRSGDLFKAEVEYLKDIYVESVANAYKIHDGSSPGNKHYTGEIEGVFDFYPDRFLSVSNSTTGRALIESFYPEWYGYNQDYSPNQYLKIYYTLPFNFDYCSPCQNVYPTEIIYSEQSFSEDRFDAYKIYLPNNGNSLPSNTGEIIGIDYHDTTLVVRTSQSCWFLKPNPQVLQASDTNVYLGTSDFLSIPPQEIMSTDIGYGGQQHVHESLLHDGGLSWVDRDRGMILNLAGKLDRIHEKGMYHWLFNYLNNNDSKVVLGYDPENKRLIITKVNNWTLTYSLEQQAFKNWTTYLQDMYFFTGKEFYSIKNNKIWKHDSDLQFRFNDEDHYAICEVTINHPNSFDTDSIHYYSVVQNLDNGQWVDDYSDTFDRFILYTPDQSTGEQNLRLTKGRYTQFSNSIKDVVQTGKNYKIGGLYDVASGNPVMREIYGLDNGIWIDKTPENINRFANQSEYGRFSNKTVNLRLIYTNTNKRIKLFYIQTIKHYEQR